MRIINIFVSAVLAVIAIIGGDRCRFIRIREAGKGLLLSSLTLLGAAAPTGTQASATYTYDLLGRLDTALYDNGTCVVYIYDANGNRTSLNTTVSGAQETPIWGTGVWGCAVWTPQ